MNVLEVLQEGGWPAFAAAGVGGLATLVGVVAWVSLSAKSRTAFTLGVVTLGLSALTATAGVLGALYGRSMVRSVVATASTVVGERILRVGHREAGSAALVGLVAALLPLLLGAVAALAGAETKRETRAPGEALAPDGSEATGRAMVALVFLGVGGLAALGAFVTWRTPPPQGRYAFADDDNEAWVLADAVEQASGRAEPDTCRNLERALEPFFGAQAQRAPPAEVPWRPAADACVELALGLLGETPVKKLTVIWSREGLLASPLLQDERLRAQVQAWQPATPDAPTLGANHRDGDVEAGAPAAKGSLPREVIQRVIRAHLAQVRYCYEKSLLQQPTLAGKVVVRFVIDADGAVQEASDVSGPAFPAPEVPACITERVKTWRFPKPHGGGVVVVTYPFILSTGAP